MVKLEDAANDMFPGVFYFHTMEDCNTFKNVFVDHWCNVPWKDPVEIPDDYPIDLAHKTYMDKDPKTYAELNLSWGFSLVKRLGIGQTNDQGSFVQEMISRIGS